MIEEPGTLEEATTTLGIEYRAWKEHEENKNDARHCFFQFALDSIREGIKTGDTNLRTKTVTIEVHGDEEVAKDRLVQKHPRYEVIDIETLVKAKKAKSIYRAILQEDPFYLPFSYVNLEDGYVYTRRIKDGQTLLDDERLKEENPDLYLVATYKLPWGDRVPIPQQMLSQADQAAIQEFIYQDTPRIELAPPRLAKAEELEEAQAKRVAVNA